MICRLWRGWATNQNADAYERIVREQVIPGIEARRIPGSRSIHLARREREHDVEFVTLMWFDSLDAVKAFMGDDYDVAHVPAEAQAMLARGLLQAGHLRPGITAEQAADIMGLQLAGTLRTARHPRPLARRALRPARRPSPDRRPAPRPAAIRFRKR